MSQHYITIEKANQPELEIILSQLANLYTESGYTRGLELYKLKGQKRSFLLLFKHQPDFEHFAYFVNYLVYPEGFDSFKYDILGYYETKDIPLSLRFKKGDQILVYVSQDDNEYDNVQIVTCKDKTYKFDFGGRTKKLDFNEIKFEPHKIELSEYEHICDVFPEAKKKSLSVGSDNNTKPWWKIW